MGQHPADHVKRLVSQHDLPMSRFDPVRDRAWFLRFLREETDFRDNPQAILTIAFALRVDIQQVIDWQKSYDPTALADTMFSLHRAADDTAFEDEDAAEAKRKKRQQDVQRAYRARKALTDEQKAANAERKKKLRMEQAEWDKQDSIPVQW